MLGQKGMIITLRQLILTILIYSVIVTGVVMLIFSNGSQKYRVYRLQDNLSPQIQESEQKLILTDNFISNGSAIVSNSSIQILSSTKTKKLRRQRKYKMKGKKIGQAVDELSHLKNTNCPEHSPMLRGKINVDAKFKPTMQQAIEAAGFRLKDGGCFEPVTCHPEQTVAIIIPYKNREEHLTALLYHLHPILQRQWVRYCMFVAEQYDDGAFNKARVMNAAFLEIMKDRKRKFDCLIFHDVDMLLEDDRNTYTCAYTPKHLSPALDKFDYKIDYGTHFGGVGAVSVEQYRLVNGHSNRFYGWGGEDSDIEKRYKEKNLTTVWNEDYGRYKMIPHDHPWYFNPMSGLGSFRKWSGTKKFNDEKAKIQLLDPSGISSIKYSLQKIFKTKIYTKIIVDVRTFLINQATIKFNGHSDSIRVENPWFTNERFGGEEHNKKQIVRGFGIEASDKFPNYDCEYHQFSGKTVNMTLGHKVNGTYNITYTDLNEAKEKCTKLVSYCQSIVEISPGNYSLRATGFMHGLLLTYKLGRYPQSLVYEKHEGVSVFAKVCSGDSRFLQFVKAPLFIRDEGKEKLSLPTHQVDFDLEIYRVENISLNYSISIYSAHKAVMVEMEAVRNKSLRLYDTLSVTHTDSVFILNMTDAKSMRPFLPKNIDRLEQIAKQTPPVLRVRTPPMSIPKVPGCYICESAITDQNGSQMLKWKWWFEVRADTAYLQNKLLNDQLIKGEVGSTTFTEGVKSKQLEIIHLYLDKLFLSKDNRLAMESAIKQAGMNNDNTLLWKIMNMQPPR